MSRSTPCNNSKPSLPFRLMESFYDFNAHDIAGKKRSMNEFRDRVVLVVNTASACGFTPQYKGLQDLHSTYEEKGLSILGFPCNQFGRQESADNPEIQEFCTINYGVTFTLFAKINVNGEDAHPLYKFLKEQLKGTLTNEIKWNFTKFLLDREGKPIKRFPPPTVPIKIEPEIQKLL